MIDWKATASAQKHYPHFDAPISLKNMEKLVRSPSTVAKNAFFPFLLYHQEWQPYRRKTGGKPDKKTRPIRYAARRDAYIFAYYRSILSVHYENRLNHLGISDCPIAYRKISSELHQGGKCNIDFANDAFHKIIELGDCVAIALDIKGYFENLDHQKIYEIWCDLIDRGALPADHQAVFNAITKYRFVDQKEVYRRLGFIKTAGLFNANYLTLYLSILLKSKAFLHSASAMFLSPFAA